MTRTWIAVCLLLAGCSAQASADADYHRLLDCEMRVLVVASFVSSLRADERTAMRSKLAVLSKEMLGSAQALGKSTPEIAEDQRQRLQQLQQRMQGPGAEAEGARLIAEARDCIR